MIANDRFDRDLQSWLEAEARTTAPYGLHDAVIGRARGSRQRPRWVVALRRDTLGWSSGTLARPGVRVAYLMVILALLLAIVVAAIAGGVLRSAPIKLGANGVIAYSVEDNARIGLSERFHSHLMNADGTDDREIGPGSCPRFSRDGAALAYVSTAFGGAEVAVTAADGSSPRTVAGIVGSTFDTDYALSPDGTRIAWLKRVPLNDESSHLELRLSPVSGGPGVRVEAAADSDEPFSTPVWSPDGRRIAFAHLVADGSGAPRSQVSIVDADGSNLHRLTTRPGTDEVGFTWSPDSRSIAHAGLPDGSQPSLSDGSNPPRDIFVIDADGTDDRDITNTTTDESAPQWSPDGGHLAYQVAQDGLTNVVTVRMDGRAAVGSPIQGPASDGFAWAPDGTRLLLRQVLAADTSSDPEAVRNAIGSVDTEFRGPPKTLLQVDHPISCVPSWQRIAP